MTVDLEPVTRILSARPKLTLHIAAGRLLREDAIPRQLEVVIRQRQTRAILFRSEQVTATTETPQLEVTLAAADGAMAGRGAPLRIEVRDPRSEEVLDAGDAELMIELTGW